MKDRRSRLLMLAVACVMAAGFLSGCASVEEAKPQLNIVWPLPPEEPKIKFVEIFKYSTDVEQSSSFTKSLFGEDEEYSLMKPYGIAADQQGNVYVTEKGVVYVFDRVNKKFRLIGTEPGPGKLAKAANVAVSRKDGRIYVTDIGSQRVFIYDSSGRYISAIGMKDDFINPIGVAVDDTRGRIYVVDSKKNNVRAFSFDGRTVLTIGKVGFDPGQFHTPSHITLDPQGNIYVVDTQNFRVQIFDPDGKLIRTFGNLGDAAGDFSRPKGIALDSEGHIYVVDTAFQNVQIFDKEGKLLLAFGGPGLEPGKFYIPSGIAIDGEDRVYVVDQFMGNVQVFQYMGEKWKQSQKK